MYFHADDMKHNPSAVPTGIGDGRTAEAQN